MKKHSVLIFVLFIATVSGALSQPEIKEGYIISNDFDTVYGKIENNNYYKNATYCSFQKAKTKSFYKYLPWMIYGYRFLNGKFYITKQVGKKKLFLEFLVDGNLNFYFYQDARGASHYYVSKDTLPLRELLWSDRTKVIDGKNMRYRSKPFTGLLAYYTLDCPALREDIFKLKKPNHKDLIKLAKAYQKLTCGNDSCIVYVKKMPRKIKISVYGGVNTFFSNDIDIDQKFSPSYGFNILFQQAQRQESLYIGLGFFREGKMIASRFFGSLPRTRYRIPLSINYINPSLGLRPIVSYQLDLNTFLLTEALDVGFKYQLQKVAFTLIAEIKTRYVVQRYANSFLFGLTYNLR